MWNKLISIVWVRIALSLLGFGILKVEISLHSRMRFSIGELFFHEKDNLFNIVLISFLCLSVLFVFSRKILWRNLFAFILLIILLLFIPFFDLTGQDIVF